MTTRRLAAILAADVVGYSRMMGTDEAGTLARLQALRRDVIDAAMARTGGRLVKDTGDGVLAEFASAVEAVRCALDVQAQMRQHPDNPMQLRIGINVGDVIATGADIHGDGVNVAARLEALAEPGGILVSAPVHEYAAGKVDCRFEDIGEQDLKNIDRKVRAYRVRVGEPEPPALPLPEKPSLVVLPFQNMSGDPEQEYFADGMVEDITTALSRIRSLFVIARNSAYTYKGRAVDVRLVGGELGVRYVLEGSVRRAGSRVRITGRLIEAATGAHLWADRFDGTLEDVFDLQDRITSSVVAAIAPKLLTAEIQLAQRVPTGNLQAYDLMLRALSHYATRSRSGFEEAIALLRKAIALDPGYALAHAHLAWFCWGMVGMGWLSRDDAAVADMVPLAQTALALDGDDPEVLLLTGAIICGAGGDLHGGIALIEKSISLNPNSAAAFRMVAGEYAFAGDTKAALINMERAERLNPLDKGTTHNIGYTIAHFVEGNHAAVLEWTGKALREQPNLTPHLRYRAASLGLLGRVEEGRQVVQRLLELAPDYTIARARRHIEFDMNNIFKTPGVADSLYEGLRRSGVPE
jgi:TolB-like protein